MTWSLFVDVVKSLSWPAAIVFLGIFFKPAIVAILPRIRKAGPLELGPLLEQQKAENPKSLATTPLKQLPGPAPSPSVQNAEDSIWRDLDKFPEDQKHAALVRALAQMQLAAFFENTYGLIFGSQILGLRRLHSPSVVSVDDARKFFEEHAVRPNPEEYKGTDFDAWISFLVARGFVTRDHEKVAITELGREFLTFLSDRRLPENKAL